MTTRTRPHDAEKAIERVSLAVTPPPPLGDSPQMRQWMESHIDRDKWTDLEWTQEEDAYGQPMGRLTGVRR